MPGPSPTGLHRDGAAGGVTENIPMPGMPVRPGLNVLADALGVSRVLITFTHERASAVAVAMAVIDG